MNPFRLSSISCVCVAALVLVACSDDANPPADSTDTDSASDDSPSEDPPDEDPQGTDAGDSGGRTSEGDDTDGDKGDDDTDNDDTDDDDTDDDDTDDDDTDDGDTDDGDTDDGDTDDDDTDDGSGQPTEEPCEYSGESPMPLALVFPEETGALDVIARVNGQSCLLASSIEAVRQDLPAEGQHPQNHAHGRVGSLLTFAHGSSPVSFEFREANTSTIVYETEEFTPPSGDYASVAIIRGTHESDELVVTDPAGPDSDTVIYINGIDLGPQSILAWERPEDEPMVAAADVGYGGYAVFEDTPHALDEPGGPLAHARWTDDTDYLLKGEVEDWENIQHPEVRVGLLGVCFDGGSDAPVYTPASFVIFRADHHPIGPGVFRCWDE